MRAGDALPTRWPMPERQPHHDTLDRLKAQHAAEATRLHAWQIAQLLQLWVSELEPEVVVDQQWQLLGLGYAGRIVVHARWLRHLAAT